jgi:hypothetical protein
VGQLTMIFELNIPINLFNDSIKKIKNTSSQTINSEELEDKVFNDLILNLLSSYINNNIKER